MSTAIDLEAKAVPSEKITQVNTIEQPDEAEQDIIQDGLRRGLLGRHISLISLASVIGASCFYGFGYALFLSGPLGALIGFAIVGTPPRRHSIMEKEKADGVPGFAVWALMQSVGEVTTMFPIAGGFIEVSSSPRPVTSTSCTHTATMPACVTFRGSCLQLLPGLALLSDVVRVSGKW